MLHAVSTPDLVYPAGTTGPGNLHWVLAANPSVATMPTTKEEQVIEELSTKEEQVEDVLRAIYGCLMDLQRIEDVDADESDEPAERSDTETSSIDDG